MGDHHVIDIHELLLASNGVGSDDVEEVSVEEEDLGAAMNALKDNNSESVETMDNENVKKKKPDDDDDEDNAEKNNAECRFCHQEDLLTLLEAPCFCNGTLKYVHRVCAQRWCDAKGNITCEICYQSYQPNYIVVNPPPPNNASIINTRATSRRRRPASGFTNMVNDEDSSFRSLVYGFGIIIVSYVVVALYLLYVK